MARLTIIIIIISFELIKITLRSARRRLKSDFEFQSLKHIEFPDSS